MFKTVLRELVIAGDTTARSRRRPSHLDPDAAEAVFRFAKRLSNVGKPSGKSGIVTELIGVSKALGRESAATRTRYSRAL